jgi:lysophospholipase L1-like esterase
MIGMRNSRKNGLPHSAGSNCAEARKYSKRYLACITLAAMAVLLASTIIYDDEVYGMTKKKHIVLLGASVGHDWKIESLPERLKQNSGAQRYSFEFVGDYQFDKTQTLRKILQRKQNRPDAILLKECAAYFPGNLDQYQELMKGWIKECRDAGVIPVPTTVVPVVRQQSFMSRMKDAVKYVLGRPTSGMQLERITQYNDWIRSYAASEKLTVLDLEAALRTSSADRSLRTDLHSGDGLHLNAKAYALLDQIVIPTLDQAFKRK